MSIVETTVKRYTHAVNGLPTYKTSFEALCSSAGPSQVRAWNKLAEQANNDRHKHVEAMDIYLAKEHKSRSMLKVQSNLIQFQPRLGLMYMFNKSQKSSRVATIWELLHGWPVD